MVIESNTKESPTAGFPFIRTPKLVITPLLAAGVEGITTKIV